MIAISQGFGYCDVWLTGVVLCGFFAFCGGFSSLKAEWSAGLGLCWVAFRIQRLNWLLFEIGKGEKTTRGHS